MRKENRLAGSFVYLAGPMDQAKDGGEQWRNALIPWLQKRGVFVLNPCNKPIANTPVEADGRADINQMKKEGRYDEIKPAYAEDIRGLDLHMVDSASFLIVHLDNDVPTCGTWEELFWANRCKKPIVVHCEQGKQAIPNWLFLTIPHQMMFSTWEEVVAYLDDIDTAGPYPETYKRWKFFDWKRLVKETVAAHGSFE